MKTSLKLILAAAAALVALASCASKQEAPAPIAPPADDGSVYSEK
ncbi:MAG: hypothetical protein ACR2RV_23900 [Verrucomicrobiales bacterium]